MRFIPGGCIYRSDCETTSVHNPHALKLHIPVDGDLTAAVGGEEIRVSRGQALLVGPDNVQGISIGVPRLLLVLDPELLGSSIPDSRAWIALGGAMGEQLGDLAAEAHSAVLDDQGALESVLSSTMTLLGRAGLSRRRRLDSRVEAALEHFRKPGPRLDHKAVARRVGISPDYLSHLIVDQVGIPAKRYALWTRCVFGLERMGMGRSATQAAKDAGFHDSAHFSRAARSFFGLPPTRMPVRRTKVLGHVYACASELGSSEPERDES